MSIRKFLASIQSLSPRSPRPARVVAAALVLPFGLVAAPLFAGGPPAVMFVTSSSGNGDFSADGNWTETDLSPLLHGLEAADKICQVRAESAGLAAAGAPIFRAWVSIAGTDAYCHVLGLTGTRLNSCDNNLPTNSPGPYYRTDGVPFIDRLEDVVSGILGTASRSELGTFVSSVAWTGSNYDGSATGSVCSNWDSTGGSGSVGSTTSEKFWGGGPPDTTFGCANSARLYCFGQPVGVAERAAWPEPAALVFVKTGGGPGNLGGLEGADVECQDQADLENLPGASSFHAWLSDLSTDAKDRLTINGPWYRVDGVRVAASKNALIDGDLDSAISVLPSGGHLSAPDRVWTGTFSGGTKSANTCSDWFMSEAGLQGIFGFSDESGYSWTTAAPSLSWPDACNEAGRFYCFGDTIVIFWDRFESGDTARWSDRVGYTP